jgi:hypothetical protein
VAVLCLTTAQMCGHLGYSSIHAKRTGFITH